MKVHREWTISGDTAWLRRLWPRVRASLDYAIATWDPARCGWFEEPWHNTYDIEFWGPDGLSSSFYLGALQAAVAMGRRLGDDVGDYAALAERSKGRLAELFNGEYFIQRVLWQDRRAGDPARHTGLLARHSAEAVALAGQEGPGYQYGSGCLSVGVLGAWMAAVCGLEECGDRARIRSHLRAVHRHNFHRRLGHHANAARAGFAGGGEGGLLLCSWPRQGRPQRPLVYASEVWTGIEHQVASHLFIHGAVEEAREILNAVRERYDGRRRNPYDEYECGHWYARALSSYALLQAVTGARYDAVDRILHLRPSVPGDFRGFLAWAGGYGTVGVRGGKPFLDVVAGSIGPHTIAYIPFQPDKTP